ncbi:MAG: hypothetical protein WCG47_20870, partial [Dermatophilaceae bacterium]
MSTSGDGTAGGSAGDTKGGELVGGYAGPRQGEEPRGRPGGRRTGRTAAARVATALASLLVWFAIVAPNEPSRLTPSALAHVPLEGLLLVALVLVLPSSARRLVAALVGMFLGLLALVKLLDMGFFVTLGRPFNPVTDWSYFGSALGLLSDSIGRPGAVVFLALAAVVGVAVLVFMPLSLARLARLVGRHRATSIRVVTALGVVWTLCAGFGVQLAPDAPIAATSAARFVSDEVSQIGAGIQDQQTFARALAVDPLRDTPADELLSGLHGKDVIVA